MSPTDGAPAQASGPVWTLTNGVLNEQHKGKVYRLRRIVDITNMIGFAHEELGSKALVRCSLILAKIYWSSLKSTTLLGSLAFDMLRNVASY